MGSVVAVGATIAIGGGATVGEGAVVAAGGEVGCWAGAVVGAGSFMESEVVIFEVLTSPSCSGSSPDPHATSATEMMASAVGNRRERDVKRCLANKVKLAYISQS